ncbi:sterigmatocystin biosynthesis cytochrome P450 monooxygenase [Microdochium nivale]|nr:sterigmatocystin biosynthesis cytochrome P450 monooxygenase [Microdochium nivale]
MLESVMPWANDSAWPAPGTAVLGAVAVALAAFVNKLIRTRRKYKRLQAEGIPILPHTWLLGHMYIFGDFFKDNPRDTNIAELQPWLAANLERYFGKDRPAEIPPVVYLDLWPAVSFPLAIVFDADMATQLLAARPQLGQPSGITRGPVQKQLFIALTGQDDIFCMEGAEWKTWRSRLSPAFSSRNITALVPQMIDETLVFARGLEAMAAAGDSKEGEGWGPVFQLLQRTTSLTVDVIARALIDRRLHDQTTPGGSPAKVALLDTLSRGMQSRGWKGYLLPPVRVLNSIAIRRHQLTMSAFLQPGIDIALEDSGKLGASGNKSIVQVACSPFAPKDSAEKDDDDDDDDDDKEGPAGATAALDQTTLRNIQGHLKVIMFAGYDTTATTMCWMFKMLQDNPDCMARLRAEHDAILPADFNATSSAAATIDTVSSTAALLRKNPHLLNSLPYTTAVIKETLRLHPPAGVLRQNTDALDTPHSRLLHRPTGRTFPTAGHAIFDGTAWIQRSPQYWPRPTEFLPERWLASKGDPLYIGGDGGGGGAGEHHHHHHVRLFGTGPRQCIGKELAMHELKLTAAMVMRRFDVREAWEEWDQLTGTTSKPHPMMDGQRLYPTGLGPAHLKDDMPVRLRLR